MNTLTVLEWRAEAERLFGDDLMATRFRCTFCKHEHTLADFKELGADPQRAPHECIGRVLLETGAKTRAEIGGLHGKKGLQPCDWACFGLFGGLTDDAVKVTMENGREVQAFPFAVPA